MTTPGFNRPAYLVGQFGTPIWGVSGVPPFTGNYFWVDETNGSDGNTGGPSDPLATLTQAHALCTANNNDVVFVSGSIHVTATLAWSKAKTHMIGLSPPSQNSRARIAISGTSAVTPLVNVTASGCYFVNIEGYNGVSAASTQVTWLNAASQNYYKNCNFIQTGNATAAAQAGSRALVVGPGDENLFEGCTIGGDTAVRATNQNYTLEFLSGSARNIFRSCTFQMLSSLATNGHVNVGASGIDRYVLFDNCAFINAIESTGTTLNAAIYANAAAGGAVLLNPSSISLGATAIATTGPVYFVGVNPGGANSASAGSIAIKAT